MDPPFSPSTSNSSIVILICSIRYGKRWSMDTTCLLWGRGATFLARQRCQNLQPIALQWDEMHGWRRAENVLYEREQTKSVQKSLKKSISSIQTINRGDQPMKIFLHQSSYHSWLCLLCPSDKSWSCLFDHLLPVQWFSTELTTTRRWFSCIKLISDLTE